MTDHDYLVDHYNHWAAAMENLPDFYEWLLRVITRMEIPKGARIVDVGCGIGALLGRLGQASYASLAGTDFSPRCLEFAVRNAPGAHLYLHDIEAGPLPATYDVAFMTTIIDFVHQPSLVLSNTLASLDAGGYLFLTIRNRDAYFPWYRLRPLQGLLRFSPWLQNWFLWFTTPLAMRRSDQPLETTYSRREMRRILTQHKCRIIAERGSSVLPMLWIPGTGPLIRSMRQLDRLVQRLPATPLCYRYLFVCQQDRRA